MDVPLEYAGTMRSYPDPKTSQVETMDAIARAETKEELEQFMENEKVDSYKDGQWVKAFRRGGPLEWYNPPWRCDRTIIDVGGADEWVARARRSFEEQVMIVPLVSTI